MRKPATEVIRRRLLRALGVLVATVMAWHFVALAVLFTFPTANSDVNPDRSLALPAHVYVAGFYGTDVEGETLPLKLSPFAWNEQRHVRLEGIKPDESTGEMYVHLRLRLGDETPLVKLRLNQVVWHKGVSSNVVFRFGDREVATMLVGENYSYWRFLTLRNSERHTFKPQEITYRDDFAVTLPEVLSSPHTSATITIPDTEEWNKATMIG